MAISSFYRRELKLPCLAFCSKRGRELFGEALTQGTLECYFPLAEQFRTQDEPAYCGLSTLTNVLNSLHIDPKREWKGVWRHFSESMLACCKPLERVKAEGVTLLEFCCLAQCNGATSIMRRPDHGPSSGIEDFRKDVLDISILNGGEFLVCSYDRKGLNQTGSGHFSPIGGYHAESDSVLILDVARFKYPPHWVPLPVLFDAMKPIDKTTGKSRGWVRLRSAESSIVFSMKEGYEEQIMNVIEATKTEGEFQSGEEFLEVFIRNINNVLGEFIETFEQTFGLAYSEAHLGLIDNLKQQVRATNMFNIVENILGTNDMFRNEMITLLLFGSEINKEINHFPMSGTVKEELKSLMVIEEPHVLLRSEINALIQQKQGMKELGKICECHTSIN